MESIISSTINWACYIYNTVNIPLVGFSDMEGWVRSLKTKQATYYFQVHLT